MKLRRSVLVLGVLLTGCVGRPAAVEVAAPSAAVAVEAPPVLPPAPTPINAGLTPAAALWHLRAGLNVAALACRGETDAVMIARYNALLARHAVALAAAQAEDQAAYRAAGGDWRDRYDDDQTRLYNFFGQAHGREGLCAAAEAALAALDGADDVSLAADAEKRLATLDQAFAPPRLEVDARVFTGPAQVMVASR